MSYSAGESDFPLESIYLSEKREDLFRLYTMGRITSIIVHEINNSMQAIQGGASLGLEEIDNPEAIKAYLNLIDRESRKVLNQTTLLRGTYQCDQPPAEIFDLGAVVEEVLSFVVADLRKKSIEIQKSLPDHPILVHGARFQIFFVLINLFLNVDEVFSFLGQRKYSIQVYEESGEAILRFKFDLAVQAFAGGKNGKDIFKVLPLEKMIGANHGRIDYSDEDNQTFLDVKLLIEQKAG